MVHHLRLICDEQSHKEIVWKGYLFLPHIGVIATAAEWHLPLVYNCRDKVPVPVLSSFSKKMQPDDHPYHKYLYMFGGVLFLVAAVICEVRHHQMRALAALCIGVGIILFGLASRVQFMDSRWRTPALVIAGVLWAAGIYLMMTTGLTK